jgi:diguanylate cyclase (GGDEF)-like protein
MKKTRAKILIVDDEPIIMEILSQELSAEHDILLASSGKRALELSQAELPDLILLDISMPDMDGFDICRRLKRTSATMNIPIIFVTAFDSEEDEVKGLELGAVDYLTKPFNMALVRVRIKNQLQLKKKSDLLEQLASLDGLTEIPNRRQFNIMFDSEWRRASRKHYPLSLFMIDIDFFKQFNDHYGHAAGDQCLIAVAQELDRQVQRGGDFVARFGGEEFVVIAPDTDQQQAQVFGEKLRAGIEALAIAHSKSTCANNVTISLGVATISPNKDMSRENLLQSADEQLYIAKKGGRNMVSSIGLS